MVLIKTCCSHTHVTLNDIQASLRLLPIPRMCRFVFAFTSPSLLCRFFLLFSFSFSSSFKWFNHFYYAINLSMVTWWCSSKQTGIHWSVFCFGGRWILLIHPFQLLTIAKVVDKRQMINFSMLCLCLFLSFRRSRLLNKLISELNTRRFVWIKIDRLFDYIFFLFYIYTNKIKYLFWTVYRLHHTWAEDLVSTTTKNILNNVKWKKWLAIE